MSSGFQFTAENQKKFQEILSRYPNKRAAMLPTLHLAQEQLGYISPEVEKHVAGLLEVPEVDVHEVLTFYSLFFRRPMGRHHIRLCMSIACWVRGCNEIRDYLQEKLGVEPEQVTPDGKFSWEAVPDCLGACELAPMMQFNRYFEGNLTREKIDEILARAE